MQYQFIFLKSQAGNLSHRGKVSKETEIALQGDKVLHHFWSKPVDLRAFLPRPAPPRRILSLPRPAPRKYGPLRSSLVFTFILSILHIFENYPLPIHKFISTALAVLFTLVYSVIDVCTSSSSIPDIDLTVLNCSIDLNESISGSHHFIIT